MHRLPGLSPQVSGTINRAWAGADKHYFSPRGQGINQEKKFSAGGLEACYGFALGFHTGAQIDDHHGIAGAGAEIDQRRVRQRRDQNRRGDEL
jgi:hypothetical protein